MALSLLRFLGACLGHGAVLIFLQNWVFGLPLRRPILTAVRKINLLLIWSGPPLLWFLFADGLHFADLDDVLGTGGWAIVPAVYLGVCWLAGFVVAPLLQVRYWLRRRPALGTSVGRTVDVAAELGFLPVGRGKHHRLARLPRNQVFGLEFVELTLRPPRLPAAWDGLSILHLSDLHLCGTPDRPFFQYVMDRCREWEPDLVALTGDVVDSEQHHRWVIPVLGRLRWRLGAFAILGNHDSWHDPALSRRRLRRLGMQVLNNTWAKLEVNGQTLVVIGHEGPWFRPVPDLAGCPSEAFRLCLSHTPDNFGWGSRNRVDLMLAGHNHGGQIRFPLLGSVFVPSLYGRTYDCGLFYREPTLLYVSRGLGGQQPVRYGCRPEVTRIVLRRP